MPEGQCPGAREGIEVSVESHRKTVRAWGRPAPATGMRARGMTLQEESPHCSLARGTVPRGATAGCRQTRPGKASKPRPRIAVHATAALHRRSSAPLTSSLGKPRSARHGHGVQAVPLGKPRNLMGWRAGCDLRMLGFRGYRDGLWGEPSVLMSQSQLPQRANFEWRPGLGPRAGTSRFGWRCAVPRETWDMSGLRRAFACEIVSVSRLPPILVTGLATDLCVYRHATGSRSGCRRPHSAPCGHRRSQSARQTLFQDLRLVTHRSKEHRKVLQSHQSHCLHIISKAGWLALLRLGTLSSLSCVWTQGCLRSNWGSLACL
mmetsp:Transcript_78987/g.131876  ORF Transcript_78987/g.131876 Transcript_78987/m.131876 type:complete len:319 (-) Transcript_78987:348-1304(-)